MGLYGTERLYLLNRSSRFDPPQGQPCNQTHEEESYPVGV